MWVLEDEGEYRKIFLKKYRKKIPNLRILVGGQGAAWLQRRNAVIGVQGLKV